MIGIGIDTGIVDEVIYSIRLGDKKFYETTQPFGALMALTLSRVLYSEAKAVRTIRHSSRYIPNPLIEEISMQELGRSLKDGNPKSISREVLIPDGVFQL